MRLKHFNLSVGTQIFKAFSDESRVRIMHLLFKKEEMCVSDLELILEFTQTKTSRHLIGLKHAGLISSKKIDQWAFYSVKEEVKDMVALMLSYLDRDATLLKDMESYEILYSSKELAVCRLHYRRWNT